jgi:hydrogenase nickel incorporation protein HypA/HybF
MHELSIASAILEAGQKEAARHPGARVTKVGVRIGAISGVVPDALSFGFECLVQGTDLEPLTLVIESVPRRQRCPDCDFTFDAPDVDLACPRCGRPDTQLAGGEELDVAYLEIEDPEPGVQT